MHIGQLERRLARAQAAFAARHGRVPAEEELAEEADIPSAELGRIRSFARTVTSLDKPVSEEAEAAALGELLPSEAPEPSEEVAISLSRSALRRAIAGLPEAEPRVIELRFGLDDHEPASQRATARELGVSLTEAIRIEQQALERLAMERELMALGEAA